MMLPQATVVLPDSPGTFTVRVLIAAKPGGPGEAYYMLVVPIDILGAR